LFIVLILAPTVALSLFNVFLIRDIQRHRNIDANRVSLAESPVFLAAVAELKAGIQKAKDIRFAVRPELPKLREKGVATYYGTKDGDGLLGHMTAYGEILNDTENTCASRHIPYNTLVWVYSVSTDKSAVCRVTDTGPFGATIMKDGEVKKIVKIKDTDPGNWYLIMDFNVATARELGMIERGSAEVILFY
jgi:rare lipoprotein A (peptidoglycan hydrolase)